MNLYERMEYYRNKAEVETQYDLDIIEQKIAEAEGECNLNAHLELKQEVLKSLDDYALALWVEANSHLGDLLEFYTYSNGQLYFKGEPIDA